MPNGRHPSITEDLYRHLLERMGSIQILDEIRELVSSCDTESAEANIAIMVIKTEEGTLIHLSLDNLSMVSYFNKRGTVCS